MAKAGKDFETVVGSLIQQIDPAATIQVGEWILGPDGRRELDVLATVTLDDTERRIHIECKDYNPQRGPIGVSAIDALESKHRDIRVDRSILCSNAGFTREAMRKARRMGIDLIGISRSFDGRLKYDVIDEIYVRNVRFMNEGSTARVHSFVKGSFKGVGVEKLFFEGLPLLSWIRHRIAVDFRVIEIVSGTHYLKFEFTSPVFVRVRRGAPYADLFGETVPISFIEITYRICGAWYAQEATIDVSSGFYDYIRKAFLHPADATINFGPIHTDGTGTWIRRPPPDVSLKKIGPFGLSQTIVKTLIHEGLDIPEQYPRLDSFLSEELRSGKRSNISDDAFVSVSARELTK